MIVPCLSPQEEEAEEGCVANLGEPVFVNVYNLHWQNGMKIGAYHTGTVVYEKEYGYGGHPFPTSGIFQIEPKDIDEMGEGFTYKETLYVGRTYLSKDGVERLVLSLTDEFRGDAYHLLHFNCNHFTANFIQLLCNGVLPKWINLLARFAAGVPFIENMLPAHWIRPSLMYESDLNELIKSCASETSDSDKDQSSVDTTDGETASRPHTNGSLVRSGAPTTTTNNAR